tara:strand:+ start:359 stop:790 length:432 start_codon:yes stop_codon:yes gene_type:complete
MDKQPGKSLWQRLCGWLRPDWLFGFLLIASIAMLVTSGVQAEPSPFVPPPLFPKLVLLIGAMVLLSALATAGAKLDRRHLDDYMFQMVANGAVIGMVTTLFLHMLWDIGSDILPPISRDDLVAVMIGSWSLGYFFYRWRGLNA